MRRALPALLMTVSGIGLLFAFHTTSATQIRVATVRTVPTQPPSSAPPPTVLGAEATTTTTPARRSIDGEAFQNPYGVVQVRVVLQGGHLVDVQALQLPEDRQRSAEISGFSAPELRREVLRAQSVNVEFISGATYTSESYLLSVQSALAQAALQP